MKILIAIVFLFLMSFTSLQAQEKQEKKPLPPQKGRTLNLENGVYASPSFDAKVVAVLPEGKTFSISNNLFAGAFYKIRVNAKLVGYIADSDIKPLNSKAPLNAKDKKSADPKKAAEEKPKKNRPFEFSRFVGPSFSMVNFEENTMGSTQKENMNFFGAKISGVDVLIEGLLPTEININYAPKAPGYYEKATGIGASGFIFSTDFLLQTFLPQGRDSLLFFGFGPMFRFSKFDVGIRNAGTGAVTNYSMQDMALGAAFNAGAALRVSTVALRLEAKYHWEKKSYLGFGAALQFPF